MSIRAAWDALLGRERKASATGPLVAMHNLGRPVWTKRDIAAIAEAGYQRQVIAGRSVDIIAQAVGSVRWRLFRGAAMDTEIEAHPLLDLLRRPNPQMGGAEFFTALISYLMIAGNGYVEAAGPDRGAPNELWPLRPDRMRVIPGGSGLPAGFEYRIGGKHIRWDVDPKTAAGPILHLKRFHPLDDWYGMAPMEHALNAIDIRNEADRWNKALLENSARPSGALVYSPKEGDAVMLTDEQREMIKHDLEERMTGPANAGRPPVLDGAFEWMQMGLSPKDMDWLEAKNISGRDIAVAFGVPPMLVGIQGDQTFANYREARLALWEETIIPLVRDLRDELNNWLVPQFGADIALREDLNDIPALTLRRERKFEMLQQADFLTMNEKRKELGFDNLDGGDVVIAPLTVGPLLGEGAVTDDDDDEAMTGDKAAAQGRLAYGESVVPLRAAE